MFDLITTSLPDLTSELSTAASSASTSFNNIITAVTNLTSLTSISAPTFADASNSISPIFSLSTMSTPSMDVFSSLDVTKITDLCHLESGGSSSIIGAIQSAVSSVVDDAIDNIKEKLQEVSQMFINIVPQLKNLCDWLKTEWDTLWTSIKDCYVEWFGNREDLKKQLEEMMEMGIDNADTAKLKKLVSTKTLWDRAVTWFRKLIKDVGETLSTLKDAVLDFGDTLKNIRDTVWPKLEKCIEDFGKLPGDVACLTKAATSVFK